MEKVICLLWAEEGMDREQFNADLLARLPVALKAAGARHLRFNLEDAVSERGAALRQSRGERQHDAMVQFWLPSANALFRTGIDAALGAQAARWCGWVVAESTIIANSAHPAVAAATATSSSIRVVAGQRPTQSRGPGCWWCPAWVITSPPAWPSPWGG